MQELSYAVGKTYRLLYRAQHGTIRSHLALKISMLPRTRPRGRRRKKGVDKRRRRRRKKRRSRR